MIGGHYFDIVCKVIHVWFKEPQNSHALILKNHLSQNIAYANDTTVVAYMQPPLASVNAGEVQNT